MKRPFPSRRSHALATALSVSLLAMPLPTAAIDLADVGSSVAGFYIEAAAANDGLNHVAGAGDVNGDGIADIVMGAPNASVGAYYSAGRSFVVFGKSSNSPVDLASFSGGFAIDGEGVDSARGGFSVSGCGDFNGDGFDDVVVGARDFPEPGENAAGRCYIVLGKDNDTTVDLAATDSASLFIAGSQALESLGYSVAGAGDVNGDGFADVIIAAPFSDYGGNYNVGESFVVFGSSSLADLDVDSLGSRGFQIRGEAVGNQAGFCVAAAGDVNGDGLDDLLVGAPTATPTVTGRAYVVFGKTGTGLVELGSLGSTEGFIMDGIDSADAAGANVSSAGDVNGDGLADLLIAADVAQVGGAFLAGECYVVFGKTDGNLVDLETLSGDGTGFRIDGKPASNRTGYSVSGAGDINGDGYSDLIIGAPEADVGGNSNAGESYIILGSASPSDLDLSSMGDAEYQLDGIDASDFSGFEVAGTGDVNSDGLSDWIISAPFATPPSKTNAGEAYVVFSPATVAASGTYRGYAATGDALKAPVGGRGNGHLTAVPDSRCWIDFDAGDDGSGNASLQTVTLTRSNSGLSGGPNPSNAANVVWEITTDRAGWSNAEVTLRYTDAEITGLTEANLLVYKAPTMSGPWTGLSTTVDTALNTVTVDTSSFSFFAISDQPGLPVELDSFGVE